MGHQAPLQIFTITQLELGSALIWEPAVGTPEHDRLVDAYIPGPANLQQKRATIALDFFDTAAASTMPAPFCRTYLVATSTPEFAAGPSYSPAFAPTSSYSPTTYTASTPSSSFSVSASTSSLSSKSSKRSISSLSSAASASPAKRLPGFSIMTADGVDITNNQSRGPKTKAQREQAAKMRKLGACPACKRSKQKCEPSHHRPAPMSASSSQNASSVSSPWQSSASASTSPGSRASISPQTSFGQSFSPASQVPMVPAHSTSSFASMAGDFVPGDWGFTSDLPLAENCNMPDLFSSDFLDFDAAAALDEDFFSAAPASADNLFSHVQDRPNMQPRGFEGGAWYNDFVLSSYFDGGDANASPSSGPAPKAESSVPSQQPSQSSSPHVAGSLEGDRGLSPWSSSGEAGGSLDLERFRDRNANFSDLVDGPMWTQLQTDANSSPSHDPRATPPTQSPPQQRQSSVGIIDDPSDPDPSDPRPWSEPSNATSTTPRRQSRVAPKHILATISRDHPIPSAVPYATDLRIADEGDLPPSHGNAMAKAVAAANHHQYMEYMKVLRDSRSGSAMPGHRQPSASTLPRPERDTQQLHGGTAMARSLVSSMSAPSLPQASASGEDGLVQWHKALRKSAGAPYIRSVPTAVPAKQSQCALCSPTTSTVPATQCSSCAVLLAGAKPTTPARVATPLRSSTSVLGGVLDVEGTAAAANPTEPSGPTREPSGPK
ncbi:hypothetical protein O988_00090 [Pseudogymnoascus sp. VKM F-3808]|nr:hypothetical protein O988_00090 [Pseudogymnoascus sp. VKM F-3808]